MRGYYRAVRRGDKWAVDIAEAIKKNPIAGLLALCYRNIDLKALVYMNNPFLGLIKKDNGFGGKYAPIPLKRK